MHWTGLTRWMFSKCSQEQAAATARPTKPSRAVRLGLAVSRPLAPSRGDLLPLAHRAVTKAAGRTAGLRGRCSWAGSLSIAGGRLATLAAYHAA